MREDVLKERIERIVKECEKHRQRIEEATEDMNAFMPLDAERYLSLGKDEVQAIDQFLFRFSKLQDAMGRKLFKLILILKEDDPLVIEEMTFRDILNHLEKIGILQVREWQRLRDIRNELSHNYDDESDEMSVVLNKIFSEKESLFMVFDNLKKYYEKWS